MLYLPFARDKRLWLPSPYLRGGANVPTTTVLASSSSAAAGTTQTTGAIAASVAKDEQVIGVMSWVSGSASETVVFSDTGVNTWIANAPSYSGLGHPAICIGRMNCTVPLTSGTSTFSGTLSASVSARQLCFFKLTGGGLLVPLTIDQAPTVNFASAATAVTPGSITPTTDQVWGVFAIAKDTTTGTTPAANWTEVFDFGNSTVMSTEVEVTNPLIKRATATNPSASWTGAATAAAAMMTLKTTYAARHMRRGDMAAAAIAGAR